MRNIEKRAKTVALPRPRILWVLVGAMLAGLAWWILRAPVPSANASDANGTQDVHAPHSAPEALVAHDHDHHPGAGEGPTAQITVWDEQYEIFAEHPLPVVDEPVRFIVHVTDRRTYRPREDGPAKFILRRDGVIRTTHVEPAPARPGIYTPELTFPLADEWMVAVAIPHARGEYVVELPPLQVHASAADAAHAPAPAEIEGVPFLKEEQWRVPVWVETVQPDRHADREIPLLPESAVLRVDGAPHVFVQVAGETFQMRSVELGSREGDHVQVLSGLTSGEQVATRGASEILAAARRPEIADHDAHDHADGQHAGAEQDDHDHDHADVEHDDHDHDPEAISFSAEDVERFGIEIGTAQAGCIKKALTLSGEIRLNRDRMAQIVPRMTGIAREIRKNLGDSVQRGEVLAVIESRPLADAKADYLAARERKELAQAIFAREERLREQEISSEQEYLDARQALTESNLLLRAARQKLLAMGFSAEYLEKLPEAPDHELTRLEITAPFDGVVIEKNVTLGERVSDETPVFIVADLGTVWLDLHAHERDVTGVRRGQRVALLARAGTPAAEGTIDYTHPIVNETTRTVLVRAVLDNTARRLRPGTFVTARVATDELTSCVTIDREAVQYLSDEPFVFVYGDGEFIPRPVTLGKSDDRRVEVVGGVQPGEPVATSGSFRLKAEIEKRAAGDVGHGHAH